MDDEEFDRRLVPPAPWGYCAACAHGLHGACLGWVVSFCTCDCGIRPDDEDPHAPALAP